MIAVDSSAVIAILKAEPEAAEFSAILAAEQAYMTAATWLEGAIVCDRLGIGARFDAAIEAAEIDVVPVDAALARKARAAFRRYGKGSGSPAGLNYGDCFSYALAATIDAPLLFKGDDFTHTDVERVR